jgi:hypothetical protein
MSFNTIAQSIVDPAHANLSFREIAAMPLGALAGVSQTEGKQLMDALDARTIGDFATCRQLMWAQAIITLAKVEKSDLPTPALANALDPSWQKKRMRDLTDASPAALAGLSEKEARILAESFGIRTIAELANHPHVRKAQVIAHLAAIEAGQIVRKAA